MKTSEDRGKEIAAKVKELIESGDLKMVDVESDAPLKFKKAVAITEKGENYLKSGK